MASKLGSYEEHQFQRVIPGNVDTVRKRICDVLEDFNYVVLGDSPIQAKRNRIKNLLSATVLEYHCRVTIGLKQISESSTLATFDYSVPYLFTKGDRQALEREAEAIIALANASMSPAVCPGCGIVSNGTVRFCRSCGAPVASNKLPAELEIMRLTANWSAAQQEVFLGLIITVLTLSVTLPMILGSDSKATTIGWVMMAMGGLFALLTFQQALRRLNRTLDPQRQTRPTLAAESLDAIQTKERALPPQPYSVTEGTTELMIASNREPARAQMNKDTDPIN